MEQQSEGKEGIVGGVAKALVKELTRQQGEIVETKVKLADKLASGYDVTIKDETGRQECLLSKCAATTTLMW